MLHQNYQNFNHSAQAILCPVWWYIICKNFEMSHDIVLCQRCAIKLDTRCPVDMKRLQILWHEPTMYIEYYLSIHTSSSAISKAHKQCRQIVTISIRLWYSNISTKVEMNDLKQEMTTYLFIVIMESQWQHWCATWKILPVLANYHGTGDIELYYQWLILKLLVPLVKGRSHIRSVRKGSVC